MSMRGRGQEAAVKALVLNLTVTICRCVQAGDGRSKGQRWIGEWWVHALGLSSLPGERKRWGEVERESDGRDICT